MRRRRQGKVGPFFKEKVLRPVVDAGAFSRVALVLDRDDSEIKSIEDHAIICLQAGNKHYAQ